MTQEEVLLAVAAELDSLGIPYAVTGSMASNAWGHPRFTHDADMLIAPRGVHAERIVETFASDFYIFRCGCLGSASAQVNVQPDSSPDELQG